MTTFRARCHCGLADYSYQLPNSALPLKSALCHCNSCRHVTGQLFATFAVIPADPPDYSSLTEYHSSPGLRRCFCPVCGASVLNIEEAEWEFSTGVLELNQGQLHRVQVFVEDTKDGGAAGWLAEAVPEIHGQGRDSKRLSKAAIRIMDCKASESALRAECHCGQVAFDVEPGTYSAGLDACTSCRTVSGFEITAWATIPQKAITMTNGHPLNFSSMTEYRTSNSVHRYFCSQCGATVFYLKDGRETIDVGVGLIRGAGARVEEMLVWEKYGDGVAYQEDAIDADLVAKLAVGIQETRVNM